VEFYSFLKRYPKRQFSRGEAIFQQAELPDTAYIIRFGIVKVYNITVNGEEKPITFKQKDEVFPLSWVFAKTELTRYYYEALTDCEFYLVPPEDYIQFLKNNPDALYASFQELVNRNIDYQMRMNALEQSKAKDKVLWTLQYLIHKFGKPLNEALVEIQLPFRQQDMANFMGLARETAAIELKKLERKGVISYHQRNYLIQASMLKDLLGDDYEEAYHGESFRPSTMAIKLVDKIKNAYGKTYK